MSDSHNCHREVEVPKGDVFIHCGDITMGGELDVLLDFNDWLGELDFDYKIVIAGNHDVSLGKDPTLGMRLLTNCIYLQDSGVNIEGYKFWGSPKTPWPMNIANYMGFGTVRGDQTTWRGMPKKIDVLVTHGPPHGILDLAFRRDIFFEDGEELKWGDHYGDGVLLAKIIERKPKYHYFGHIHEAFGYFESPFGTKHVNCSVMDEKYNVVNKPVETWL